MGKLPIVALMLPTLPEPRGREQQSRNMATALTTMKVSQVWCQAHGNMHLALYTLPLSVVRTMQINLSNLHGPNGEKVEFRVRALRLAPHPGFFRQQRLMSSRSDFAIDLCRRLQGTVHSEQTGEWNTKEGLVLLKRQANECPVLGSER